MKRLINVRPPLFCVLGLVCGILSAYELHFGNFWFLVVLGILILTVGILLAIFKRRYLILLAFVAAFIAVGYFLIQLEFVNERNREIVDEQAILSGRVSDIGRNGNQVNVIYLEDCKLKNGEALLGKVECVVFDGSQFNTGDIVQVKGFLNSAYPVKDGVSTYLIRSDINYSLQLSTLISQTEGGLKLDETIRKYVYDVTAEYMPNSGSIMYALLTGDRNAMDGELLTTFKYAGIVHLLAVSGLHVGFLVAVFGFILKRFGLHPLLELAILLVPLVFYAYICGFSPSVVRAVIMLACVYLYKLVFDRYDLLTSLSIAAIVILLIQPLYLFDVGFQLSFLSVFGIATIYLPINRAVKLRRIPKALQWLINSVAMSLSCTVATFFASATYFGYVSLFGVLVNIIAIPMVSVSFVLGFIGLIPWLFHYALWLPDKILQGLVIVARFVASLDFAVAAVYAVAITIPIAMIALFILGGYVNFKKLGKAISCIVCVIAIVASIALSLVPQSTQNQAYVAFGYNDCVLAVTDNKNNMAIVGDFSELYTTTAAVSYASKYKTENCDLYITSYSHCDYRSIDLLADTLPIRNVYVLDHSGNDYASERFANVGANVMYLTNNSIVGESIIVQSLYDGSLCGVSVKTGSLKIGYLFGSKIHNDNLLRTFTDFDVIVTHNAHNVTNAGSAAVLSYFQTKDNNNFGYNKYGKFIITETDSQITLSFR